MRLPPSFIVAHKELLSSLRDRQTALYTFVLPLVLYPGVFWLMVQGMLVLQGQREHTAVRVGLTAEVPAELDAELAQALGGGRGGSVDGARPEGIDILEVERDPSPRSLEEARSWAREEKEGQPRFDAVLHRDAPAAPEAHTQVLYDSSRSRSELARDRLLPRLEAFVERLRVRAARERDVDPRRLQPLRIEEAPITPRRDIGALILSSILPILLVVMAVMGAFFPAVDLAAGEKERRTAETTLLLPLPRSTVLHGKILAVTSTAVVAVALNLFAIGLSAEHLMSMLTGGAAQASFELPLLALLAVAPLAILFAFFVSAVLTAVAGLAATFKEGQALLGPVQMVFILPAMIGVIPGLVLSPGWALVPVVNVVLAFRSLLRGEPLYLEYALCSAALLVYALAAVRAAVWILSREEVALAGATLSPRRLFTLLRGRDSRS